MATDLRTLRARRAHNEHRCRRLTATAAPLRTEDLDWPSIGDHEVGAEVLHALVYMRDVEGFTDRDLVGLAGHRTTLSDPVIGPFLAVWRSEEAGHTAALDRFLSAYASARGVAISPRQLPPPATAPWLERAAARVQGPVGQVVAAAHMVWGAANEQLTLQGYRLLARRCGHPVLATLLGRIADQEARHFSFYFLQGQVRLADSRIARAALPRLIGRAWTPVGVGEGYKAQEDFDRLRQYLASGDDGRAAITRMDNRFASLPGFQRLRIYQRALG